MEIIQIFPWIRRLSIAKMLSLVISMIIFDVIIIITKITIIHHTYRGLTMCQALA